MNRPSRITGSYTLERWERWAEWPLAGVAAVFLVVYSVQVLAQPRDLTKTLLEWFLYALYLAFAVDYVVRLILADQRTRWFFRHLLDLAIIAIPFLRPLRMLILVVLVGALQKAFGDATLAALSSTPRSAPFSWCTRGRSLSSTPNGQARATSRISVMRRGGRLPRSPQLDTGTSSQ